jgi:hypothetical protein
LTIAHESINEGLAGFLVEGLASFFPAKNLYQLEGLSAFLIPEKMVPARLPDSKKWQLRRPLSRKGLML